MPKSATRVGHVQSETLDLQLERYRCRKSDVLGEGGWCVVYRGEASDGREVAIKTFRAQASDAGSSLQARFEREVQIFRALGIGPGSQASGTADELDPRCLFVNLLDFSATGQGFPGPAADGRHYTVLELGDESLDLWLRTTGFIRLSSFCDIASALCEALRWLHSLGFVHLDIKPENIVRFGSTWKLIDLAGCLSVQGESTVSPANFTPLYASPEQAKAASAEPAEPGAPDASLRPAPSMDLWAAGVVMLDVLVQGCCLAETKASLDLAALFDEESVPFERWYRWLASEEPLDVRSLLSGSPGAALLSEREDLHDLLVQLLQKEPGRRSAAALLREHPLLRRSRPTGRQKVELAFSKAEKSLDSTHLGLASYSTDQLMQVMQLIGVSAADATCLLTALQMQENSEAYPLKLFLDFLYSSSS